MFNRKMTLAVITDGLTLFGQKIRVSHSTVMGAHYRDVLYQLGLVLFSRVNRVRIWVSVEARVMEHIICSSVMTHAADLNILYLLQHGFRSRQSCETKLLEMINDVANNMQLGLQTEVCVLNFSKTFDSGS